MTPDERDARIASLMSRILAREQAETPGPLDRSSAGIPPADPRGTASIVQAPRYRHR